MPPFHRLCSQVCQSCTFLRSNLSLSKPNANNIVLLFLLFYSLRITLLRNGNITISLHWLYRKRHTPKNNILWTQDMSLNNKTTNFAVIFRLLFQSHCQTTNFAVIFRLYFKVIVKPEWQSVIIWDIWPHHNMITSRSHKSPNRNFATTLNTG